MKSKFKDMDILRLIENQHNMTKGGLYCANQIFESNTDIPVIETVDDYGLVVSLYETSFEATDIVLDVDTQHKMSVEDSATVVDNKIEDCYVKEGNDWLFVSDIFITKIQQDKELQKALLVLIRGAV